MMAAPAEHQSSFCDAAVVKQEPVEADADLSPNAEFEYVPVKQETTKCEVPEDQDSSQDPLNNAEEESSSSEDLPMCSTFNIEKTEDLEDNETAVSEDDGEEYSSSEEFLEPSTFGSGKSGDEEDEEAASKDDLETMGRQKPTEPVSRKSRYSNERLKKVLEDNTAGRITQRKAARQYNFPSQTIVVRLKNRHSLKSGKPTVFTKAEERSFVEHCLSLCDMGLPVSIFDLRCIAKSYLDNCKRKVDCFLGNMPGWRWGRIFLKRYGSELSHKFTVNTSNKGADLISTFFDKYKCEVEGVPAENVFSFDEIGFYDIPAEGMLMFRQRHQHPARISKSRYTVVFCGNAAGEFLPPYIIFSGNQKWTDGIYNSPSGTRMNSSESGWIEQRVFDDWFQTHFLPYTQNKVGKTVIIGNNLTSHISMKTLELCEQKNIKFICLPLNTTNFLRPLNVAYLSSVEKNWREVLSQWRGTREGCMNLFIPKGTFSRLLAKALQLGEPTASTNLVKGFENCGLYPVGCGRVLQCLSNWARNESSVMMSAGNEFRSYLQTITDSDHCVNGVQKYKMPIEQGKSASAEDVRAFYGIKGLTTNNKGKRKIQMEKEEENEHWDEFEFESQPRSGLKPHIKTYAGKRRTVNRNQVLADTPESSSMLAELDVNISMTDHVGHVISTAVTSEGNMVVKPGTRTYAGKRRTVNRNQVLADTPESISMLSELDVNRSISDHVGHVITTAVTSEGNVIVEEELLSKPSTSEDVFLVNDYVVHNGSLNK